MYQPAHFALHDPAELQRLMVAHPLGALVRMGPEGLEADHLPFEFQPEPGGLGRLTAHVARANPLWQACADQSVLVIFQGEQGYISPNWYPSKHETHRHVPTWNYEVVHARGVLTVQDDATFVRGVLARLTRVHEAAEPQPWRMTDSAPEFIDTLLAKVVGIEVRLTALEGKAKLSQNREARDREGAVATLQVRGQETLAARMAAAGGSTRAK